MTLHLIPISRADLSKISVPTLVKGGTRAHKYWKREPYFSQGKRKWRYYYNTAEDRAKWRKEHDAHHGEEQEHLLRADIGKVHENLRRQLPPTAMLTAEQFKKTFGIKTKFDTRFENRHRAPFVHAEEAENALPQRNPLQRVHKALSMMPAHVLKHAKLTGIRVATRDAPDLVEEFTKQGVPVPAVFITKDGILTVCADGEGMGELPGFTHGGAHGWPKFGSPLTAAEESIWSAVGARIAKRLSKVVNKEQFGEWKDISSDDAEPPPGTGHQHPNIDFGESLAMMLAHPQQLAKSHPQRYEFLRENGFALDMPAADEVTKQAGGQYAWWTHESRTRGKELLEYLQTEQPASPTFYHSEKDEFYQVSAHGRTVYVRMGPQNADEEDNWESMPETIDPETGHPYREKTVANRFKAKGNIKEIFDEHGTRLSDLSAYFYLNQHRDGEGKQYGDPSEAGVKQAISADQRLGKKMFDSLGQNTGDMKKERAQIAKLKAKGPEALAKYEAKTAEARWLYVPHKISEAEFHSKADTFAFAKLKEADFQTDRAKTKSGAGKTRTDAKGKRVAALNSRLYESVNPDGSTAAIRVREAESFTYGERILVPKPGGIADPETGEVTEVVEWQEVELNVREHPKLSDEALAKQYRISAQELTARNGKVGQWQIDDPLISQLINPMREPVRTRETLMRLLQQAADVQPRAWVSLEVDDGMPPTSMHAEVKFDGGGSPVLVGEYWKKKLGKDTPRVSDLITGNKLKRTDRVRVLKPRARKIRTATEARGDGTDKVRVKIDGKMVYAQLLERRTGGGRREYDVFVEPGQLAPTAEQNRTVRQVFSVPTDVDLRNPKLHRRQIQTPRHDLVLYADELTRDAKGSPVPGSGKVKIALPSDGSVRLDQVLKAPGVRVEEDGETITLNMGRFDDFRDAMGGFVMDEHVQLKLQRKLQVARLARSGKESTVHKSQLVDPENGNTARTDGLLKGMKSKVRGRDFALGDHQVEMLQAMADNNGRILGAHFMGTGKTISAIAAIKMMQNLKDPDDPSKPHKNRPKRVCIVAPKNTLKQWEEAVATFTHGKATVLGPGAGQLKPWSPPKHLEEKPPGMSQQQYNAELDKARAEAQSKDSGLWKAHEDNTDIVVVGQEFWQRHNEELKRTGGFDGIVVDEAHGIQRENERSKALEDWNPQMKMMMLLTGTPITNKLDTLPRYISLLTQGQAEFGTQEEFRDNHMTESAVMRAYGRKGQAFDIDTQKAGELRGVLQRIMHVATTADVKGKVMPAVALDENNPVEMTNTQAVLYRMHMKSMSDEDKEQFDLTSALGEEEAKRLSADAKKSVLRARNTANCIGFKSYDENKFVRVKKMVGTDKEGEPVFKNAEFRMPTVADFKRRWKGKWPTERNTGKGFTSEEFAAVSRWAAHALGVPYDKLAGKPILSTVTPRQMRKMQKGEPLNGIQFGSKVDNPEYGPEGMLCRGHLSGKSDQIESIRHEVRDRNGKVIDTIEVPAGLRFIRDPGAMAEGVFYMAGLPSTHEDSGKYRNDWDFDKKLFAVSEDGGIEGKTTEKQLEKGQRPKAGLEGMHVTRHPSRRRERKMFDLSVTHQNAKTDEMERWINQKTNPATGGDPDRQMIFFGKSIGSSVRTMEAKMRMMGYQDVNEALNIDLQNPDEDHPPHTGKYFVTYFGDQATTGERDINSEIFRKRKDASGKDMEMSMFVHRTLNGTNEEELPKAGTWVQGWNDAQRKTIKGLFKDASGGMEVPLAVVHEEVGGSLVPRYVYESSLRGKEKAAVLKAEQAGDFSTVANLLHKHKTDRSPMTSRQVQVMNNCQHMVASDAAQVGLNWGNATDLMMYDSLFSPMNEWQRITRAARMLPPAVEAKMQKHFDALGDHIEKLGSLKEYDGNETGALKIVEDALKAVPEARKALLKEGLNPTVIAESFLAQRVFDRIATLRGSVETKLRQEGRTLDVIDPTTGEPKYSKIRNSAGVERWQKVLPAEINSSDVMNEIVDRHLKPFERAIMRSRKYLVDVKRLTTSVEMPVFKEEKLIDPVTGEVERDHKGRPIKIQVDTGKKFMESPTKAEKSIMTLGRAKQVPYENMLNLVQNTAPPETGFDFHVGTIHGLSQFGTPVKPQKTEAEKQAEKEKRTAARKEYQAIRAAERARAKKVAAERRAAEKARKAAEKAAGIRKPVRKPAKKKTAKKKATKKKTATKKSMFYVRG